MVKTFTFQTVATSNKGNSQLPNGLNERPQVIDLVGDAQHLANDVQATAAKNGIPNWVLYVAGAVILIWLLKK